MSIDWFTFFAQVINFFILLALLKRFLYDRVVAAMDQREKKIEQRLQEAEQKKQEAELQSASLRKEQKSLVSQKDTLLAQARQQADNEHYKLVQEARHDVDHLKKQWLESLDQEKAAFLSNLRQRTAQEVFNLSRHVFRDLADVAVEDRIVDTFVARLQDGTTDTGESLADFVNDGTELTVRSSSESTPAMRRKITDGIHEHLAKGPKIIFETNPELIMGIELRADGRKISWNVDHYLDSVEAKTREALGTDAESQPRQESSAPDEQEPAPQRQAKQ